MKTIEISQARALLEKAELEIDPVLKINELLRGLEMLRACEEEDIPAADRILIKNIKTAQARRLLAQLNQVKASTSSAWSAYVHILVRKLKEEVRDALAQDEQLAITVKRFLSRRDEEIGALLYASLFEDGDGA